MPSRDEQGSPQASPQNLRGNRGLATLLKIQAKNLVAQMFHFVFQCFIEVKH
jgi:hypothetical protein